MKKKKWLLTYNILHEKCKKSDFLFYWIGLLWFMDKEVNGPDLLESTIDGCIYYSTYSVSKNFLFSKYAGNEKVKNCYIFYIHKVKQITRITDNFHRSIAKYWGQKMMQIPQ